MLKQVDSMTSLMKVANTTIMEVNRNKSDSNTNLGTGAIDITLYVLSIILFGISIYVFMVLCIYLHRFLQKRRHSRKNVTSAALANGFGKIALSMRFVALFISLLCVVHFILNQVLLHSNCCDKALETIRILIYGFVVMFSYVFFWLRQRVLYDAPAMKLFNSRLLRILSWLSLGFVALNSTAQIALTFLLPYVENRTVIYLIWLFGCVAVQGTLMSLFLYPLRKHGQERKKWLGNQEKTIKHLNKPKGPDRKLNANETTNVLGYGIRDSNIFTVSSSRTSNGSKSSVKRSRLTSANPMYRAARRCVVCAAIAFISDLIASIFMIVAYHNQDIPNAAVITNFLFDVNLVVNSSFAVGCFANWRSILFPKTFRLSTKKLLYLPTITSESQMRQKVFVNNHYSDC